jgi:hypothetical protein
MDKWLKQYSRCGSWLKLDLGRMTRKSVAEVNLSTPGFTTLYSAIYVNTIKLGV